MSYTGRDNKRRNAKRRIKEDMPSVRQKVEDSALSKAQVAIFLKRGDKFSAYYEEFNRLHELEQIPHKYDGMLPGGERKQEKHEERSRFVPDYAPLFTGSPLEPDEDFDLVAKHELAPEFARVNEVMEDQLPSLDEACADLDW